MGFLLKGIDMSNWHNLIAVVSGLFLVISFGWGTNFCWAGQEGVQPQVDIATAQLAIEGKFIVSLVLEDEKGQLIALGSPEDVRVYRPVGAKPRIISRSMDLPAKGETVSLATGRYRWNSVTVSDETKKLKFGTNQASREWIELSAGSTTTLRIGAPLVHTVKIGRLGGTLHLDYEWLGAAGEKYLPVLPEGSQQPKAPDFAIHRADDKIFSGSFRYG